jgi:NitT/TauT family transport system ATP-binding protein
MFGLLQDASMGYAKQTRSVRGCCVIRLIGVSKKYGHNTVVDDVDLTVNPGELVCITGASGVGKSTLLHLIAGLVQPDSGSVQVASRPLAYVFQEPRLLPWCDVTNNVQVGLHANGFTAADRASLARDVLERVGLADASHLYPSQLSGGMRQRVALARAFVITPRTLLLDEPFSALDHDLRQSLRRYLDELLSWRPCTTVFVTHDLEDAVSMGDRIIVMRGARAADWSEYRIDRARAERSDAFCLSEITTLRTLSGQMGPGQPIVDWGPE